MKSFEAEGASFQDAPDLYTDKGYLCYKIFMEINMSQHLSQLEEGSSRVAMGEGVKNGFVPTDPDKCNFRQLALLGAVNVLARKLEGKPVAVVLQLLGEDPQS